MPDICVTRQVQRGGQPMAGVETAVCFCLSFCPALGDPVSELTPRGKMSSGQSHLITSCFVTRQRWLFFAVLRDSPYQVVKLCIVGSTLGLPEFCNGPSVPVGWLGSLTLDL